MNHPLSLATLLTEPELMRGVFQRELPPFDSGRWEIRSCEVRQTRRRISSRTASGDQPYLDICYRLDALDRETGANADRWLYGKAYHASASAMAFNRARVLAGEDTPWGPAVTHMPALDMVLWRLPNDPTLSHLVVFLDPRRVSWQLSAASGEAPTRSTVQRVAISRLEPEEHCTARFEMAPGSTWPALYGKCYADDRWRLAWRCMNFLHAQGQVDEAAFAVPRPVAGSEVLKACWQEESTGTPLEEHLVDLPTARRVGRALARLHRDGPRTDRRITPADLLEQARKWRNKLVQAHAIEPVMFDALLAQLQVSHPAEHDVPIHGDFHVRQMLLGADGRIQLFDYDGFATGSPCFDVAHFVSQWMTSRADGAVDPRPAVEFVRAWREAWGSTISAFELDWYLRMMFLRKAYSFFVNQGTDWVERADLAIAHAQLGLSGVGTLSTADR